MCATNPSGLVLVVEDEWLVRDVIATDFKDAGWHVLEASTGESAIGIIAANPHIDVLFTDIQLAGQLSGWDVAEAFRAAKPEMPVIYASGNTLDRARGRQQPVLQQALPGSRDPQGLPALVRTVGAFG